MSDFRFAEPEWAYALWAVLAFVALLLWLERRGAGALDRLLAVALQTRLVRRPGAGRRQLRVLLLGLACLSLIAALMRPQWGLRRTAGSRVGAELMICLDVSRSMLAEDVAPNRLERAKAEIVDLLAYLQGNQVGLIAFAGRASVLSPLTPDFGFLRLVLEDVGPQSVTRGGTHLEEPIRKAVAGFGPAGSASRAILLITDGEDHDSFPLDAAKQAAEQGIRILAIGLGDEAGSQVTVTDPRTGARTLLRDDSGQPVRTRLDGDLLRDLALATDGAYIPAGTGLLDLESIYKQHIARLTRGALDPRGKLVRDELYQWAILLGIICLVANAALSGTEWVGRSFLVLLPLALATLAPPAHAAAEDSAAPQAAAPAAQAEEATPQTPRELYNRGVAALQQPNLEEAERWLSRARREAHEDGRLRFQATYNLGWLAVQRSQALEADQPAEALKLLYQAADWFRDAAQQRPEDDEPRVNLDVTLRRALLLADRIAQQDPKGIEERLDQITDGQRAFLGEAAGLLGALAPRATPEAADRLRPQFRSLATSERTLLSDSDELAAQVGDERDAIENRSEAERKPADSMRAVQLDHVLHHLHAARERMGQARRQLRQRQAERAYRRASTALDELKRAQDQLRDPVQVLSAVSRDATELHGATGLLAEARRRLPGDPKQTPLPPWLTPESLREHNDSLHARIGELAQRLRAGLEGPPAEAGSPGATLRVALEEAEPLVREGRQRFDQAGHALGVDDLESALEEQRAGITALLEARERFLDVRGLIEAAYATQRRIEGALSAPESHSAATRAELAPGLRASQQKNLSRSERLERRLEEARMQQQSAAATQDAAGDSQALAEQAEKRFEQAQQLLLLARNEMRSVQDALGAAETSVKPRAWEAADQASGRAVQRLEALRRLFLSIVERVQELHRRQVDLGDETQDAGALAPASQQKGADRFAPLASQQQELAKQAEDVAWALAEQSTQQGENLAEEGDSESQARRLREAGEHVLQAQTEMDAAAGKLAAQPAEPEPAQEHQRSALAELVQALQRLASPQQESPQQGESPQQNAGNGQGGQGGAPQAARAPVDPGQLLQQVRDREAQRRRERATRQRAGNQPVEKDW